jgi:type III secretion protein V
VNRTFASLRSKVPDRPAGGRFASAEVVLAAFVVLVVGLMIVPLPTPLLDVLIATNLSASVVILLVVLYVADAIRIATFPTLLLLTTLFRLALNVASTRLILLQADAGQVIRAFGTFVVRGNYVVGGVVFLVLTIIQFIVVAKGSERVAEVGARFALDAMPGKQMAIDAELRGGTIDGSEARRRRRLLSRESQFYGAMDGAMKFVKGDVIASLLILAVNLVGGLTIGVVMKNMPVADALRRYGLLTIGDGLVTQIPALVLSTGAGVLVTRVASEEADTPLGEELARQLLGVPKALQVASVFVLLLAAVPGLPALPFAVIGVALLVVGRARTRAERLRAAQAATEPTHREKASTATGDSAFVPMVLPWSIEISADLRPLLDRTPGGLRAMAVSLRDHLFAELGVPLPAPRVRVRDDLGSRQVLLSVHEVPAQLLALPAELSDEQAIDRTRRETVALLRSRAADFVGLAEVQRLLDELEQFAPATVRNVVPRPVSLVVLADVLRRLLDERVSIRDLKAVLEGLSMVATTEKDPLALAEHVRAHLRRAITFNVTGGTPELGVVLLDPTLEDTVRRAVTRTPAGAFLALPPQASRDVRASVRRAIESLDESSHGLPRTILTQPDIRRFVRKVIEVDHPEVWVVTFGELLPEITIKALSRAVP